MPNAYICTNECKRVSLDMPFGAASVPKPDFILVESSELANRWNLLAQMKLSASKFTRRHNSKCQVESFIEIWLL